MGQWVNELDNIEPQIAVLLYCHRTYVSLLLPRDYVMISHEASIL